jgi:pimeloyl-ACP methyl ester carboxylesterase
MAVQCQSFLKKGDSALTHLDVERHFKYEKIRGLKVPYLDLKPYVRKKGTIVLVSGFSKHSNSWLLHMESLRRQGYRVITYDQTNVGRNLRENGIQEYEFGEGLKVDAYIGAALLRKLNVKSITRLVGHSRGAWVASKISNLLLENSDIKIKRLDLKSPYVEYIWSADLSSSWGGGYFNAFFKGTLAGAPGSVGEMMAQSIKTSPEELVPGLSDSDRNRALGYILKGTHPGKKETTTLDSVILALKKGVKVRVDTDALDKELAPLEVVRLLDIEGVHFNVLDAEGFDHYWVERYPEALVESLFD